MFKLKSEEAKGQQGLREREGGKERGNWLVGEAGRRQGGWSLASTAWRSCRALRVLSAVKPLKD